MSRETNFHKLPETYGRFFFPSEHSKILIIHLWLIIIYLTHYFHEIQNHRVKLSTTLVLSYLGYSLRVILDFFPSLRSPTTTIASCYHVDISLFMSYDAAGIFRRCVTLGLLLSYFFLSEPPSD